MRRRGPTQTATQVSSSHPVTLVDASTVPAYVGDWLITSGGSAQPLSVCPAASFRSLYEVQQDGSLTLSQPEREALEILIGLGAARTPATLLAAVDRLASIRIGDVRLEFTPGQLEELQHRAAKRGQTVEQSVQAVVDRIRDEIFHRG